MHLRERLQSGAGPSLSFEFFPPKNEQAASALYQTIRELEPYRPSFVSVTYGAGGSTRELTREVVLRIQHESRIPTVPHLTCVGHSREEVWNILDQYARAGVRAVLALRGDPPRGAKDYNRDADVFRHAADLVTFIREYNESGRHPDPDGFAIGVAGVERGDGALGMSRVPGAHAYRVQLGEFNHFVNVGEQAGHAVFLGAALHGLFIYIAQRVYLDVGVERICAQMHARNVTVADNAYFEFLIH